MHHLSWIANLLGMELSFTIEERAPQPARVEYGTRRMTVTKVQRSAEGFKTTTGTTLTCKHCRGEDHRDAGVEPYPMATWLLTGEGGQFTITPVELSHRLPGKRVEILPLCSDHFKTLRERNRVNQGVGINELAGYVPMSVQFEEAVDARLASWDNSPPRA